MNSFFSKKTVIIMLVAVFLALVLGILSAVSGGRVSPVSSFVNMISKPIQSVITGVSDFFADKVERATSYDKMKEENKKLKQEVAILSDAVRKSEAASLENEQLRAALGMKEENTSFVFESAEVVAKNSDNWNRSFTINKGTSSGIALDNCVITADGMVGYISEVGPNWATVLAIIDTTMEASAIASRTRDVASVEGDYELMSKGYFKLSYLPRDTRLLKGDIIETSGFGGLFPKGIVLGSVVEVKNESHGISKYAVIKPAVDMEHVNQVLVIKSFKTAE